MVVLKKSIKWALLDTKGGFSKMKTVLNKHGFDGADILEYIEDGNVRAEKKSYRKNVKNVFIEDKIGVNFYEKNGNYYLKVWGISPKIPYMVYKNMKL